MTRRHFAGAVLALLLAPVVAKAGVVVQFVGPDRFADQDFRRPVRREALMRELELHLKALGERYLPPQQTLTLEITDLDLAGRYEPFSTGFNEVRVMRDITPPRVKLSYRLTEGGRTIAAGSETISDLNYLSNIRARNASGPLPYEKAMLDDWFRRRFGQGRPARG
ncbi:DUF3016 domain-containing protein [Phreatobacter sp. AB_2022a]|uniref:DUF3016 domain-containing protein n=1 Tax=Phreatobacter sp. AB_2022a TaxID=3003134 RepID=UPI0022877047|nr:DUF3016 domain-containing protein [Phreatobacter sp. AB_2022a]MCZ0733893.1 DUF3016 domain-containing protein [Phreatobacter sp. AB_2022a]